MSTEFFDSTKSFREDMPVVVSVSMLVYNHGRFLRQALDSVLMQRVNFRYQIVVGEDASVDNSREILLGYAERYPDRFRLILHDENVGMEENVNSKLPYLIGEFIAPLEGDDYWTDPNKLQKQVDFLRANQEFSAVSHQIETVDENGNKISDEFLNGLYRQGGEFSLSDLLQYRMPGQTASMVFRNYLLCFDEETMRAYVASRVAGDRKQTLVNTLSGRIWCMPETMSAYRRHADSWNAVERAGGSACYHYFESYQMEKLARDVLDVSLDFSEMRKHAWFGTVAYFIRNPSKENFWAVIRVFRTGGNRVQKILFLLTYLAKLPKKILQR